MRKSETYSYNECIEAAAKLDLIGLMIESMEDTNEEILTDEEYTKIVEVQNTLDGVAKIMKDKAKLYATMED
jgi:hypothetical protein